MLTALIGGTDIISNPKTHLLMSMLELICRVVIKE